MPNHSVETIIASDWWSQFLADKDTTSWKTLSNRYGVAVATLRKALETVGSSKKPQPAGRKAAGARPVEVAPKVSKPVTKRRPGGAKVMGRTTAAASVDVVVPTADRKPTAAVRLKEWHDRMGKEADGVIAKEAGVDRRHVVDYRKAHGIPAYEGHRGVADGSKAPEAPKAPKAQKAAPGRPAAVKVASMPVAAVGAPAPKRRGRPGPRPSKLDAYRDRVGTVSDTEIAKLAGVSAEAVRQFRLRNQIPGVSERSDVSTAAETPAPKAPKAPVASVVSAKVAAAPAVPAVAAQKRGTAGGSLQAFAVVAARGNERQRFVVTSPSIAEAAAQAALALSARGPEWSVRSIRHLCEALA